MEYLHFGRLIGESVEESEEKLNSRSIDIENDGRAQIYLEKWEEEEEASYAMFETLLRRADTDQVSKSVRELTFDQLVAKDDGIDDLVDEVIELKKKPQYMELSSEEEVCEGGQYWGANKDGGRGGTVVYNTLQRIFRRLYFLVLKRQFFMLPENSVSIPAMSNLQN